MLSRILAIATLLVAMTGCGSSSSPTNPSSTPSPSGSNVSIVVGASTLTTTAYSPNPITVTRGSSVTWVNNDTVTHTATANDNSWDSGPIAPRASFSRTFAASGTFAYRCTIHPGMIATVTVQ